MDAPIGSVEKLPVNQKERYPDTQEMHGRGGLAVLIQTIFPSDPERNQGESFSGNFSTGLNKARNNSELQNRQSLHGNRQILHSFQAFSPPFSGNLSTIGRQFLHRFQAISPHLAGNFSTESFVTC
jgi:hypothetical protein|tara:strand:+ start:117 stop:494 length:378 start_codon:yes stop_codon:yes gene_type:complete